MAVSLAAVAAFLFYLNAIPIKFALVMRVSGDAGFGAGAAAFEGRFALRSAGRRARSEKKHPPQKHAKMHLKWSDAIPAVLKAGRYLLRHLHLEVLHARGRISTPDAAKTAMICGCASALEGALRPCTQSGAIRLALQPDFSGGESDVTLYGMVSLRAGHIMLAALIGAWNYIYRRIRHGKASH